MWSKEIIMKIENKEDLQKNEIDMLKCILAGYEAFDRRMNEILGIDIGQEGDEDEAGD